MHKEVNYKMAAMSQFGSLHATLAMFLILVCFTFSSQVDSRLEVRSYSYRTRVTKLCDGSSWRRRNAGIFKLCTSISSV